MPSAVKEFAHPENALSTVWGAQLYEGEKIEYTDLYDAPSRYWEPAPLHRVGSEVEVSEPALWIRPENCLR